MMKICSRCGKELPDDCFRDYYGGRSGKYSYCKTCEKIESRYKYLIRLGSQATQEQLEELAKIEKLYDLRIANGLKAPHRRGQQSQALGLVEEMLKEYDTNEAKE